MLIPRRVESTNKPSTFEDLGNGNWYYNYDIQLKEDSFEGEPVTKYDYIQVKMAGKPTYKKCVELIIGEFITQSQEFDLINTYNRVSLSLTEEDNDMEGELKKYTEYLNKVQEIKKNIKKDF